MLGTKLVRVTDVRYAHDYVLSLCFSDGLSGEIDLGNDLRGDLLRPLRDPAVFPKVHVDSGILVWPNGLDWSSEDLYERVRSANGLPAESGDDWWRQQLAHAARMPEISRFFGIIIRMFATEHEPPHFHAIYGEYGVSVTIRDRIVSGRFPPTALRLVLEWGELHQRELLDNWERMRRGQPPEPISPLE